jgi:hypothetical protein
VKRCYPEKINKWCEVVQDWLVAVVVVAVVVVAVVVVVVYTTVEDLLVDVIDVRLSCEILHLRRR